MEVCKNCTEGLVSQGESIKTTCTVCGGTGKVEELSEITPENTMPEEVVVDAIPEETAPENFSEGSGEEGETPVPEEVSPTAE